MPIPLAADEQVDPSVTETMDVTSNDTESTQSAEAVEDGSNGQELFFNGDTTILATEGDDTISPDPDGLNGQGAGLVQLGSGDDIAQVNVYVDSILGEAGDDRIEFLEPELGQAFGGEGNDTLAGIGDVVLDGGAGNDVIITDFTDTGLNDNAAVVRGGDGDDHFIVTKDIAATWRNTVGGAIATGGEGADLFELNFVYDADVDFASSSNPGFGPEDSIEGSAGISIGDFDTAEDMLRIDVVVPEGETLPVLSNVEIETLDREGFAQLTYVHVTLEATETQPETRTTITLKGLVDIGSEDIEFVNVSPMVA